MTKSLSLDEENIKRNRNSETKSIKDRALRDIRNLFEPEEEKKIIINQ